MYKIELYLKSQETCFTCTCTSFTGWSTSLSDIFTACDVKSMELGYMSDLKYLQYSGPLSLLGLKLFVRIILLNKYLFFPHLLDWIIIESW